VQILFDLPMYMVVILDSAFWLAYVLGGYYRFTILTCLCTWWLF
jgi:hypothetical protein